MPNWTEQTVGPLPSDPRDYTITLADGTRLVGAIGPFVTVGAYGAPEIPGPWTQVLFPAEPIYYAAGIRVAVDAKTDVELWLGAGMASEEQLIARLRGTLAPGEQDLIMLLHRMEGPASIRRYYPNDQAVRIQAALLYFRPA